MNCNRFEKLIALYVEGDLSRGKSRRVETHLNTCSACHQLARELSRSQTVLKSLGDESIDSKVFETIQDRVLDQLVSGKDGGHHTLWYPIPWSWRWNRTAVVGLFLLIGALAVWNIRSLRQTPFNLAERDKEIQTFPEEKLNGRAAEQNAREVRDQESMKVPIRTRGVREGKGSKRSNPRPNPQSVSEENLVTAASRPQRESFATPVPQTPQREGRPFEKAQQRPSENQIDENNERAKPGPLVIKLVTDDPEVVIVWLVDPDKGERQ